ncbi:Uncharacterised protein [uncultured Clostridium sp.]|nr:Uncharacterised protein [uncultured Clostridium sp.]
MYPRIESRLAKIGMTKRELAAALGLDYEVLLLKLERKDYFTLDEAIALKRITGASDSIEELFTFLA